MRPIQARISSAAFRHNYLLARQRSDGARAWAVVKANAYGHGLLLCADAIRDVADGYAVLEQDAALSLREAGFNHPILRLEGPFSPAELAVAAQFDFTLVLHDEEQILMLERSRLVRPVDIYIKLNTGMNRLGFAPERFQKVLSRLGASGKVRELSVMTHFACADEASIDDPLLLFAETVASSGLPMSMANSAALLRFPATHGEWVRPGIMLYGASPMPSIASAAAIGLKPVMTLKSRVIGVQQLRPGDAVGYGATFVAEYPMRVGTVACGYADGYPRHATTGTPVLVNGQRTATLGRVSMDMLAIDLTDFPDLGVGAEVTLWGEGLPADEVAEAAGTISYALFCAVTQRVPVVKVDG